MPAWRLFVLEIAECLTLVRDQRILTTRLK